MHAIERTILDFTIFRMPAHTLDFVQLDTPKRLIITVLAIRFLCIQHSLTYLVELHNREMLAPSTAIQNDSIRIHYFPGFQAW